MGRLCGFPAIAPGLHPSKERPEARHFAGPIVRRHDQVMFLLSMRYAPNAVGGLGTVCGLVISLLLALPPTALADDGLQTSVSVLASIAGRIRVISENCRFSIDPMLEGRIMETLRPVPEISMSDVVALLVRSHEIELHARGRECRTDEDAEHLKTLKNIYQMSIANLKDLVAARQAD